MLHVRCVGFGRKFVFLFCRCLENKLWSYNLEHKAFLMYSYRLLSELPNTRIQIYQDFAYTFQISHVFAILFVPKVHGGTTYEDIKLKVNQAEEMARENQDKNIDTVLFFDEANTTEALSMIKEVMVDRRINGRPIGQGLERLQFIAACNPYRR